MSNQDYYIEAFKKLKRGNSKGLGLAPHKPILLISVIQLIQSGVITSAKIYITPTLIATFKNNWKQLVDTEHIPTFSLPFFHMRTEPFWNLHSFMGFDGYVTKSKSIKSLKALQESVSYAAIDLALFMLCTRPASALLFIQVLLDTYFRYTQSNFEILSTNNYTDQLEQQLVAEPSENYIEELTVLKKTLKREAFEEEIYVRQDIFKKGVPKAYQYTCCISGLHIQVRNATVQMIDACHIIPHRISHDDRVINGLSLTPTLHRAFDRGLITIDNNYKVNVSKAIQETPSKHSISQFHGQPIILPKNELQYPSLEALAFHKKTYFIQ